MSEPKAIYDADTSSSFELYKSDHAASIRDISSYWSELAKSKLEWYAPFPNSVTGSFKDGSVSWFAGGKLNVCYNAVDRYCIAPYNRGNETAIIWEGDEPSATKRISFFELQSNVCRIANALKASGVRKGDVVTLYMPMVPELAYTMLACARIGAVHSVIFAGFSADAIADRIEDAKSKWVVTASAGKRGGRDLPLKNICDAAVKKERCVGVVEKVFVFDGKGPDGSEWAQEDVHVRFSDLTECQRPVCSCEWMDAEDPLFILYTSGSTGRPKG
jgi:acetyl-CoA synthetase